MYTNEAGTKSEAPVKGPARSTSSDWHQPDTIAKGEDKAKSGGGSCNNVGKTAGQLNGAKGGEAKIW
jgi:hypothetical protein